MNRLFPLFPLLILCAGCATVPDPASHTGYAREATRLKLSPTITLEISPEVELLSCVLSQTSWMDVRGPDGRGNTYYRDLRTLAAPLRDHPAVTCAERLTRLDFTYDAPPNFILRTRLPDMRLIYDYSAYLTRRAQGRENLDAFRALLRDFARESGFQNFFNNRVGDYRRWLETVKGEIAGEKITAWLNAFFGRPANEFHIILAPAMPTQGGYGFRIETARPPRVCQVIRERGTSEGDPEFFKWENELNNLTIHEFSHSFVNPAVEKREETINARLLRLYRPAERMMRDQAYGSPLVFFIETVVRAVTILCMDDLFYRSEPFREYRIEQEEKVGFYLVRFTMETLSLYRNSRGAYRTFDEFLTLLFKSYERNAETLLEKARRLYAATGRP